MNFPFLERKHEDELFKEVFKGEAGKELIAHLSSVFHVFKTTQTPDPYVSAFQEGQRSVVIKIMEMLHQDLDAVKRRLETMEQQRLKRRQ
jgi:predicted ATP-dependent serine protease|tara:strand:+ start:554 stop:823 length:270 start_codon:yes stop_codon:yes gene_type:complete